MLYRIAISIILFSVALSIKPETDTLYINVEQSKLRWEGSKVSSSHYGHIDIKEGYIVLDSYGGIVGGRIDIDMNSMECDDIQNPESSSYLVSHLKGDDFFSVSNFPISSLTIDGSKQLKPSSRIYNNKILGKLKIKGISHPIAFPLMIEHDTEKSYAQGEINFDRTLWGIKYNSSKYFPEIGDRMILDLINLQFYIETK